MVQVIAGALPDWGYGDGSDDGYGYGYGYGDGYDDGSGYGYSDYGYGCGDDDGSGYGYSGYGYGYGSGSGYGSGGNGYGHGSGGNGYGDGYGDGHGYGHGSKEYWLSTVAYFAGKWTEDQRARLGALRDLGATIAFWRSDDNGRACNGGRNDPVKPGTIETSPGPLNLCSRGTLHATLLPPKWQGERWWIVALTGEVVGDEEKYGALSREIIGEAL